MDFLPELIKQGTLGVLLAISLTLNFYLGKLLLYEKDRRIQAAEKVRDELVSPIGYIKDALGLIQEKIRISKEAEK